MRDHVPQVRRPKPAKNAVGVRELKTHAARILRHVREARASYVLTHRGRAVGVILPLDPAEEILPAPEDGGANAGWHAFLRAGRRLEGKFRPGASGGRVLSEMRR
ncbi:MAG: type II toxin-antitoxin system Phd/YefM family antitoxin [Vicinamibacterales bacterium]|nr:type II toxin-antitoxin system Phd/YefM family antitoxin [Vicinamibacterales bacterium]